MLKILVEHLASFTPQEVLEFIAERRLENFRRHQHRVRRRDFLLRHAVVREAKMGLRKLNGLGGLGGSRLNGPSRPSRPKELIRPRRLNGPDALSRFDGLN